MSVKLKVIHGALKRNERFQVVIPITKTPFAIGRSPDCDMRCHSAAISRRHCEIRVAGFDVTIVDLNSRNGVRVNSEIIQEDRRLRTGDRIAVGRLEFELIIEVPKPRPGYDPWGDSVCELLLEADRSEPEVSSSDSRWYKIEPVDPAVDPYEGMSHKEKLQAKARKKIPTTGPQKLPKRVAESADVAIRQALAKYSDGVDRCYRRPQLPLGRLTLSDCRLKILAVNAKSLHHRFQGRRACHLNQVQYGLPLGERRLGILCDLPLAKSSDGPPQCQDAAVVIGGDATHRAGHFKAVCAAVDFQGETNLLAVPTRHHCLSSEHWISVIVLLKYEELTRPV